uniref:Uncharacterized protein n=1 Tax=Romanomermis culicivorax TaxID=13658 RepID=A0A915L0J8_ROMCU
MSSPINTSVPILEFRVFLWANSDRRGKFSIFSIFRAIFGGFSTPHVHESAISMRRTMIIIALYIGCKFIGFLREVKLYLCAKP